MDNPSTPPNPDERPHFPAGNFPPNQAGIPPYPAYFAPPVQELRVGFGKRLGAWIIDLLISGLISGIFAFLLKDTSIGFIRSAVEAAGEAEGAYQFGGENPLGPEFTELVAAYAVIGTIFGLLYHSVELFTGATPAKHMLGLQVAYDDGRRGNLALWAKRWFIKESATIVSFFALFGDFTGLSLISGLLTAIIFFGCFAAIGEERKALHDYLAGTAVFHTEDINRQAETVA